MKVKLGNRYRDTVSGFEGIATAKYEFLNKCIRVELTAPLSEEQLKESKKPSTYVIDIDQAESVRSNGAASASRAKSVPSGGPPITDAVDRGDPE